MIVLSFVFLVVLWTLGTTFYIALHRAHRVIVVSARSIFHALLAGILLTSLLSVVLLEASRFSVANLCLLAALVVLVFGATVRRLPTFRLALIFDRQKFVLAGILLLAAFLRFPPSNWIAGGIDAGVYVNVANHIRQHGTVFIRDNLLHELRHHEHAREYYLQHSYLSSKHDYTPGIPIYDLDERLLIPQFYHLHPLWLAISSQLFGAGHTTVSLPVFGILSVLLMYLLVHSLVRDQFASLAAALLLAVNPLHSYMSKYPVSEVPTAFFFLSALYFFVRLLRHDHARLFDLCMAALSFTCLFFTRITGFLHMFALVGLLFCVTILCTNRSRRRAMFLACAATGAGYVYSVVHGSLLSPSYSQRIYYKKFGIDGFSMDTVITLAIVLVATAGSYALIARNRSSQRRIAARVYPYRRGLAFAVLLVALVAVACRGYTFAFTDLAQHPWLGTASSGLDRVDARLKLSGSGLPALLISDISVLSVILTPLGFALSLYGLYLMLRRWPSDPSFFICGSLGVFFLVVYGVGHGFRPILYLWGRFLLSELVPLLILAIGVALSQLRRRYPRATVAALILMCLPALGFSYLHTRDTEMKYLYEDLARIDEVLGDNAIVLVDERIKPDRERMNLPLSLLFDRKTFWFSRDDLERGRLDEVLRLFADKGYRIFVIANDDRLDSDQFKPHQNMPVRLTRMSKTLGSWPVGFQYEQRRTWTIYRPTGDLRILQKAPEDVLDSKEELL